MSMIDSVKNGTVLTERNIIGITYNLLNSLHFLHKVGLMHRDLKPANILISPDGQVKIIDFGLSRTHAPKTSTLRKYRKHALEGAGQLTPSTENDGPMNGSNTSKSELSDKTA